MSKEPKKVKCKRCGGTGTITNRRAESENKDPLKTNFAMVDMDVKCPVCGGKKFVVEDEDNPLFTDFNAGSGVNTFIDKERYEE